ncbi:hypothetical protein DFH06DRAFT_1160205 [Mycena polygramma]|nr:hypothetical protein DFH06DRAFT_1160205 [Mycena polygramma]
MSAGDLCSSLVGWFNNRPDDVLNEIALQSNLRLPGMRRMDPVEDATLRRNVRMAAQRILRWDTTGPEEIFQTGFQPRVFPNTNEFPAQAFNLRTYVADNHPSIFVSTTQPYRDDAGRLTRWERRLTSQTYHRFEYEIFAYGGIDVNRALGVAQNYYNQREIAFAGGIIPEMIRSAREYTGTQVVRIWINTHFDNTLNPAGENPPLAELPDVRRTPGDAEVRYFPGPGNAPPPDRDELRRRRSADTENDDIMFPWSDGVGVADPLFDTTPVPLSSVASVWDPTNSNRAYFFCGNRYTVINVNPGTTGDTIAWGPKDLVDNWPSLWKAGFSGGVDAVLPKVEDIRDDDVDGHYEILSNEMYFFSGGNYALINIAPGTSDDYIINGPKKILDEWPSLRKAGFAKIDAVLPNPANRVNEAYFFSGSQYALLNIKSGTNDDYIVNGPKPILDNWPSLKKAGFGRVDTILPNPANRAEAYFFSGSQYALINIKPGSTNDYIVNGPKSVGAEWPSLKQSAFW